MKITIVIVTAFTVFFNFNCIGQHTVETNKIIRTKDHKSGVISQSGELIIDSIFPIISVLHSNNKKTHPGFKQGDLNPPIQYYLVHNSEYEKAIFDANGKKVFDFTKTLSVQFDPISKTVVTNQKLEDNRIRHSLYDLNNQLIFNETFEDIVYIKNSNLIALVKEQGSKDELYLYNYITKERHGVYTHFNVFTEGSHPPLGMKAEDFVQYEKLNVITVRVTDVDGKYSWGIIDLKGNKVKPITFKYFRYIEASMKSRYIDRAITPANTAFLFYGYRKNDRSQLLFFDADLKEYALIREPGKKDVIQLVR